MFSGVTYSEDSGANTRSPHPTGLLCSPRWFPRGFLVNIRWNHPARIKRFLFWKRFRAAAGVERGKELCSLPDGELLVASMMIVRVLVTVLPTMSGPRSR